MNRAPLLDELRGLMILNVVAFHFIYDLVYLFGVKMPWFSSPYAYYWQQIMAGSLIFFAGISCNLARSNIGRGLKTLGLGLALTLITFIAMPSQTILFGILHFMGSAMILYAALKPVLSKIPTIVGLCGAVVLFIFTKGIYSGHVGFGPFLQLPLPAAAYSTNFLFWLGLPGPGFASADYFPLLPWLFLFLAGSFLGVYLKQGRLPKVVYQNNLPPLAFVGRHTMAIYLIHQPVIYGVLWACFAIFI